MAQEELHHLSAKIGTLTRRLRRKSGGPGQVRAAQRRTLGGERGMTADNDGAAGENRAPCAWVRRGLGGGGPA